MFKEEIYSEMKIHKYTVIIVVTLFVLAEGVNITEWFVKEGQTFIFHLPHVESDSQRIRSAEWTQMDKGKLLAIINLKNANDTITFHNESKLQFMLNGSIIISDVTQEDTGNYTCKIVFKDNRIQTHIISLKLSSEITEQSPDYNSTLSSSEITEQTSTNNSTSSASDPQDFYILQIVLSVLGGLILLAGLMVIILKCKMRYRSFTQEPIYINSNMIHTHRRSPNTLKKQGHASQRQIKT